jgi:hypothetical protein
VSGLSAFGLLTGKADADLGRDEHHTEELRSPTLQPKPELDFQCLWFDEFRKSPSEAMDLRPGTISM